VDGASSAWPNFLAETWVDVANLDESGLSWVGSVALPRGGFYLLIQDRTQDHGCDQPAVEAAGARRTRPAQLLGDAGHACATSSSSAIAVMTARSCSSPAGA
jgi:hypothetical protein